MRLVSARSRVRSSLEAIRVGVVGNISACHADAPGSIPGRGVFFFITNWGAGTEFFTKSFCFFPTAKSSVYTSSASIAQLAEHLLRKEKVTSSILVGGCGSHGLVGYDARLTRERSRVRASVRILPFFFFAEKKTLNNKIKNHGKNTLFYPYTMLFLSHCLLLIQEALIMIQACIMCLPRIDWVSGSFAYKFFQNWLRVLTLASVRSTLTLFRRRCYGFWTFYANKKKFKTTTKTCLKMWLVNKKKLD